MENIKRETGYWAIAHDEYGTRPVKIEFEKGFGYSTVFHEKSKHLWCVCNGDLYGKFLSASEAKEALHKMTFPDILPPRTFPKNGALPRGEVGSRKGWW